MTSDDVIYRVERIEGLYRLVNTAGHTVLECSDESSARHYATLLNNAYRSGYRQGYRDARHGGIVP